MWFVIFIASFLSMSRRIILKWFASRYPIFIFRFAHLKFFRIMFGWLKDFIFLGSGLNMEIRWVVIARLSLEPAYPMSWVEIFSLVAILFIAVKWSMFVFCISAHRKLCSV